MEHKRKRPLSDRHLIKAKNKKAKIHLLESNQKLKESQQKTLMVQGHQSEQKQKLNMSISCQNLFYKSCRT